MRYTNAEAELIDGVIGAYFAPLSIGEELWMRYRETHDHILQDRIDQTDLRNIKAALAFLLPVYADNRQTHREMISALAKTDALLQTTA